MELLPYLVFLGLLATGSPCQITVECDTACTALKTYISEHKITETRYRLQNHVSTPTGWMNDPNGFVYYKGLYHIFYQYYPYAASALGKIFWGHSTSTDLVTWTTQPTALLPETESCFSGSAIVYDTTLVLMYTAHITADSVTQESQYLAFSDDGINFLKYSGNPVLTYAPSGSANFRDPKVWKYGDLYYVIIGTKIVDSDNTERGSVRIYSSEDLLNWTFRKTIAEASATVTQSTAFMWECPDFFSLGGKYVLLMSPQGMETVGDRYKNKFQTGYILGTFSYDTYDFVQQTSFEELDYGHDFYATQTTENNGKRYLSAWFGMWGSTFPEAADGWAGALTLFRELTLSGTRILMNPVAAITTLRETATHDGALAPTTGILTLTKAGELIVTADWTKNVKINFEGQTEGTSSASLTWDATNKIVAVTRGTDDVRQVAWAPETTSTWRIFLDTSSIEVFCGIGDVVFSTRVYPLGGWKITNLSDEQSLTVVLYPLKSSVPE